MGKKTWQKIMESVTVMDKTKQEGKELIFLYKKALQSSKILRSQSWPQTHGSGEIAGTAFKQHWCHKLARDKFYTKIKHHWGDQLFSPLSVV